MLPVFVAQSLLDYVASRHTKWGLPLDMEYDFPGLTAPENDSLAADSRLIDMACGYLIQAFRQVEVQLAESGQVLGFNSPDGVAFALGDLVGVFCSKVSPFGSVQAFSSGFVSNFSKTVSALRIVMAHHSNTQADHADSSSRDKGNQGDIHAPSINTSAPS